MYAKPYKIYKGINGKHGALQLDLIPVEKSKRDLGVVLITFAAPKPDKTYDWNNKVVMGLNLSDIANIFEFLSFAEFGDSTSIYHDPNAGTTKEGQEKKKLALSRGREHGWFMKATYRQGDLHKEVNLPVKDGEMMIIRTLLQYAIPHILGW